jgi:hypothetical protein
MFGIYIIWRIFMFMLWFGVMFAVCTVVIAVAFVFIIAAILMGLVMPSRTVLGQLRSLDTNVSTLVAEIRSKNPRAR